MMSEVEKRRLEEEACWSWYYSNQKAEAEESERRTQQEIEDFYGKDDPDEPDESDHHAESKARAGLARKAEFSARERLKNTATVATQSGKKRKEDDVAKHKVWSYPSGKTVVTSDSKTAKAERLKKRAEKIGFVASCWSWDKLDL